MSIGLCSFRVLVVDYNAAPIDTHQGGTARPTVPQQSAHFSHVGSIQGTTWVYTMKGLGSTPRSAYRGSEKGHPTFIF